MKKQGFIFLNVGLDTCLRLDEYIEKVFFKQNFNLQAADRRELVKKPKTKLRAIKCCFPIIAVSTKSMHKATS